MPLAPDAVVPLWVESGRGADGWGGGARVGNAAICHIKSFTNNRIPLD